jgi:hypothetical protein
MIVMCLVLSRAVCHSLFRFWVLRRGDMGKSWHWALQDLTAVDDDDNVDCLRFSYPVLSDGGIVFCLKEVNRDPESPVAKSRVISPMHVASETP